MVAFWLPIVLTQKEAAEIKVPAGAVQMRVMRDLHCFSVRLPPIGRSGA